MAVDLATAKAAAQKRGLTPPPEWKGNEDNWYTQWFQNGVDSGDPSILKDAGLWQGAEAASEVGGKNVEQGYNRDYMNSAAADQWLGKRAPTPSELRRYAKDQGWSEDYARFSDAQLANWLKHGAWDIQNGIFQGGVQKPTEVGGLMAPNRVGGGAGGGGGMGGGGGVGPAGGAPGQGTFGGAPSFYFGEFKAPTMEEAMNDPGYQMALKEGLKGMQQSQAAQGLLRTGGSLKDLMNYGQGMAAQQYGNVYNRAANTYGTNLGTAKDIFAPQFGSWQTAGNWDLSKWSTKYGGQLQRDLQREGNIYGLLNPSMPSY